jgi:FlaG/FlaF family flagellin (archaellin)
MIQGFNADERGVSEVIGAILVFGVLVALLAIIQAQAIPAANEKVEFNHNQELQADFVNFNTAMAEVGTQGTPKSVKIQMGTTYPSRLLFFNPGPPGGEIRSAGSGSVSIYNVNATDSNTEKYIDDSMEDLTTRRLEYDPTYNEYRSAPVTVLEYGAVYRDFENEIIIDDESELIRGNTISLMLLNGNLSKGQATALSLEAQATSAPARTVQVEANETADNITINIPTNLEVSDWEEMIGDEEYVEGVVQNGSKVEIRLNSSQSYNLRVPQIGVGTQVPTPEATYLTRSSNRRLQIDRANTLPVEVRDRYNNPVSGESINLSVDDGEFENGAQTIESNTSKQGRPTARYFGGAKGVVQVEASLKGDPSDPSYTFQPNQDPKDIRMNVAFDPRLDNDDPSFNSQDLNNNTYDVCTEFGDETVDLSITAPPPVGTVSASDTILSCLATGDATVLTVEYDVSDTGGSGLDFIELGVVNESDVVVLNKTHVLEGVNDQGKFFTPQILEDENGEPEEVEVTVYDRNGNNVTVIEPA